MNLALRIAASALVFSGALQAQTYPVKPIRYIVPFPAGASPDMVARLLSSKLSPMWGQQVVVDNRSGVGGTLGAGIAARSAPDGYTIFQCNIASNAIAASTYRKLPYDPMRDFEPISRIGTTASVMVVYPGLKITSVGELVAQAKAQPGKLSYGSSGAGTSPQLAMELFKTMAGIDIVHIAYRGATPALADLMAGQVPISISNLPAIIGPAQAGRMRPLAVTSAKRAAQMPNVPTMIESGLPGYEVTSWYGVCAPARTPRHVIDKWHGDLVRVLSLPEVRKRFTELVIEPAPTSQGEFASFIRNETQRWARVVKDAKLEPL